MECTQKTNTRLQNMYFRVHERLHVHKEVHTLCP